MRLRNCTEEEIAAELGCTRGRVRTKLHHIREQLQRLAGGDAGQPPDLLCHLRRWLAAPASEYLRDRGQSAEFAPGSPLERTAAAMSLGELFQSADSSLGLLIAVKRRARGLIGPEACGVPYEAHQLIYFASIAAALVHHGEKISKSGPEVLRVAWERLAGESYAGDGLQRLFATAQERLSNRRDL
jgi:hypothetical protein